MEPETQNVDQIGAIPLRRVQSGAVEVLLVTSRQSKRWVIPKGWPWPNCTDHLSAAGEAFEEAGIKAGHPNAANSRVKILRRVFKWAVENELIESNPARDVPYLRVRSGGYHTLTLTEAEIQRFEERWPIGTKERLAFALLRYLGVRRSDVVRLGKQHLRNGWLVFTTKKGGAPLELPIPPELQNIIEGSPTGDLNFLMEYGKPFTPAGFGGWFRERCDAAGLPHCSAHGLRKAAAASLAEAGASSHQLMAWFGWRSLKEAERYTRAANQKKLAATVVLLFGKAKNGT